MQGMIPRPRDHGLSRNHESDINWRSSPCAPEIQSERRIRGPPQVGGAVHTPRGPGLALLARCSCWPPRVRLARAVPGQAVALSSASPSRPASTQTCPASVTNPRGHRLHGSPSRRPSREYGRGQSAPPPQGQGHVSRVPGHGPSWVHPGRAVT